MVGRTKLTRYDQQAKAIIDAVESYDIADSEIWNDLDALSTHTSLDAIEVDPEGVIIEESGRFSGVLNVYVLLQYGNDKDEGFETSDSFLGHFQGHLNDKGSPIIENISVDTSPFYKGEQKPSVI